MTTATYAGLIGTMGMIRVEDFTIMVTIEDVKNSYGTVRYLVTPVHGTGTKWVAADRVKS